MLTYATTLTNDSIYPDASQRVHQTRWAAQHLEIKPSSLIHGGIGVFAKTTLLPNTRLGYYAGTPTHYTPSTEHLIQDYVFEDSGKINGQSFKLKINAAPYINEPFCYIPRINEYIWDHTKNNCRFLNNQGGILITTKIITAGSELFLNYGHFNWASYIRILISHSLTCLRNIIQHLECPWHNELNAISTELDNFDLLSLPDHLSSEALSLFLYISGRSIGRKYCNTPFQRWFYKILKLPEFRQLTQFRKAFHPARPSSEAAVIQAYQSRTLPNPLFHNTTSLGRLQVFKSQLQILSAHAESKRHR